MKKNLGWIRDLPDQRDHVLRLSTAQKLPSIYEMKFPAAYDQGQLGSCTAQATCGAFQFTENEQDGNAPIPSRLALYYWTRLSMGTESYDSGASIRDALKAVARYGMCKESIWPYDTSRFSKQPNANAIAEAAKHKLEGKAYGRIERTVISLKTCLAANNPIVFGFTVYESFMSEEMKKTGMMQMPKLHESVVGGHAVLMIGYDDAKRCFLIRNSWGPTWGIKGNFWMPYDYAISKRLADDFWSMYKVAPLS